RRSRRRSPPPVSGRPSSCTAPTTAASAPTWSTAPRTTSRRAPGWNWSRARATSCTWSSPSGSTARCWTGSRPS
ncbi:LOW QUALITY PROTEIN: hypothetical protein SSOG_08318, partial [Streptomyces himastatinicus ATCC 53653]